MSRPAAGSGAFALPAYVNDNWPPVLTRREAAKMCRISVPTFDGWVRKAILPKPIPGTRRWSRVAIECALGGGGDRSPPDIQLSAFERWSRDNAH
jgi:predicted DNA-binding transcriptional regulator AlpA